jgi:GrpB-like predicted nucleotidyltransferase (UPF0157 family)/chloramphenicol 3-O-phosphotransferase
VKAEAEPAIFLISGPMAAGKSTVAQALAERFDRGVHLEGDLFRRSIVRGRAEMTPDVSAEAHAQLRLRYRVAAAAADAYHDAGFTVALEDVYTPELLADLRTSIRGRPCHAIVLLPSPETLTERERRRRTQGYGTWTVEQLYAVFESASPRVGLWLDTSKLSVGETVDQILAETDSERTSIVIAEYDSAWPALFERLAGPLRAALTGATVEHIGSTAVPGLAAKPIIDIDAVVGSPEDVPAAIATVVRLGYVHQGDVGISGRETFLSPPTAPPHHLYLVVAGGEPHRAHLDFRDHLRANPESARRYAALKRELAERFRDSRNGYTQAKSAFVESVLSAAPQTGRT